MFVFWAFPRIIIFFQNSFLGGAALSAASPRLFCHSEFARNLYYGCGLSATPDSYRDPNANTIAYTYLCVNFKK